MHRYLLTEWYILCLVCVQLLQCTYFKFRVGSETFPVEECWLNETSSLQIPHKLLWNSLPRDQVAELGELAEISILIKSDTCWKIWVFFHIGAMLVLKYRAFLCIRYGNTSFVVYDIRVCNTGVWILIQDRKWIIPSFPRFTEGGHSKINIKIAWRNVQMDSEQ